MSHIILPTEGLDLKIQNRNMPVAFKSSAYLIRCFGGLRSDRRGATTPPFWGTCDRGGGGPNRGGVDCRRRVSCGRQWRVVGGAPAVRLSVAAVRGRLGRPPPPVIERLCPPTTPQAHPPVQTLITPHLRLIIEHALTISRSPFHYTFGRRWPACTLAVETVRPRYRWWFKYRLALNSNSIVFFLLLFKQHIFTLQVCII